MWPFTNNKNYKNSGLLANMTDWHSHILPGVDEGVQSIEEALVILKEYQHLGINEVWLTPRISEDTPNNTIDYLNDKFAKLKDKYDSNSHSSENHIILHLSSLNIIDAAFEERLKNKEVIPYGLDKEHLLITIDPTKKIYNLKSIIKKIIDAGYQPVFANPERYLSMNGQDYRMLHDELGVQFLMNIPSLVGLYGPEAMRRSKLLLESNYYSYIGSDNHGLRKFFAAITEYQIDKKFLKKLKEIKDSSQNKHYNTTTNAHF